MRYLDLADALRARIAGREFGAGGALPSEGELGRNYGTSRVTVRRALDLLRQEGLVVSRRGAGWFVALDPVRQPLGRITTVEGAVEAAGAIAGRRILSFGYASPPARVSDVLGSPADVLRIERVNLADGQPFAYVTVWVRGDLGAELSRADVERAPLYDVLPLRGVELTSVHQTITAEIADDRVAALLEVDVHSPLLLACRVTRDSSGSTVMYSEHRSPAARTQFEIEFSLSPGALQHV
ncbi:MAG TPA: GntR family transcriptional regulator [Acidimicrobiia bacterium]|nr:GntR family transcriptional regulator [Acidimicrobiia bacterium]